MYIFIKRWPCIVQAHTSFTLLIISRISTLNFILYKIIYYMLTWNQIWWNLLLLCQWIYHTVESLPNKIVFKNKLYNDKVKPTYRRSDKKKVINFSKRLSLLLLSPKQTCCNPETDILGSRNDTRGKIKSI